MYIFSIIYVYIKLKHFESKVHQIAKGVCGTKKVIILGKVRQWLFQNVLVLGHFWQVT